ncbi:protein-L-isoaspartate(D-aspartate) O-methyltransferase [Actinoalloteichus hoggarensis]|uniref:Protein-L-isoaspartate O-methyltransferase n=1 Tax=Actinoalloteichus hoggarensis TaxID=1470176 RepID=A0A221W548_9PSEU|nr:methyltransferase domain-containing protein [Actinoalloteichus hoggarensis]ASO20863.1 Protein-L-isoaspartate O-methyltransferase [Actinoalloteichus hoggarensis]MBB5920795.1 protein-L-isoaspartate(D-aspartate) O-methyltransferase [Actinoalloteichus hoggarensis]
MITTVDSYRLRHRLADSLRASGYLQSRRWLEAFRTVPREAFVDRFIISSPTGEQTLFDLAVDRPLALEAVYRDTNLLTQRDAGGTATSSSTTPSLMALMLERLDLWQGHSVLEIGTGTGYNTALLCHVLGDHTVTSIDIDPGLVVRARDALDGLGHHPHLIIGDGTQGVVEYAPYDRLIATCGVARVPASWLRQVAPDGVILVNLGYALARLTVDADGRATGPFTDYAAFMRLRPHPAYRTPTGREIVEMATEEGARSTVRIDGFPDYLGARPLECLRALVHPDVHKVIRHDGGGEAHVLGDPATGSWARARFIGSSRAAIVHGGVRDLWDDYMRIAQLWNEHGRPEPARYGLTITPDGVHTLWLDCPEHPVLVLD